ncbi:putative NADH pyrophosphatase [Pillotina sp. SPG140]|jgi:ADP-ribose pyrophosphatase YjhB (NUDIX family)
MSDSFFHVCPKCGSPEIRFERDKLFTCPACGFHYYHNVAAATACVIRTNSGILLLTRAKEPAKGALDLPGGFVDPGEGAVEGVRRECREELNWDLGTDPQFFASFPNTYQYRGILYRTCDLFFYLNAADLSADDLQIDPHELSGIQFVQPEHINYRDIAFESARYALRIFVDRFCS